MPKTKREQTRKRLIKYYVGKGYSANRIQKELQKRRLGIRRKTLLTIVRHYKKTKKRPRAYKCIPKKYRKPKTKPKLKLLPKPEKEKLHRFEYTRYYNYTRGSPSKWRSLECRLSRSLTHTFAQVEWRNVETIMDDYLTYLGFEPAFFTKTRGGIDYLGKTATTRDYIILIDKRRRYKWDKWL